MKKRNLKNKLALSKEIVSSLKAGASSNAAQPAKCSDSYIYYCTWEIDCPSVFHSCDYYCSIA
jgi:hypothetical protein